MRWIGTKLARLVAGTSVLALALSGCHQVNQADAGVKNAFTVPHVLRYTSGEDLVGLSPLSNPQLTLAYLSEMTMAWLFRYDHNNQPIPELATVMPSQQNGGISADGRTITFHLRKGVQWSDGAPFTADDVVFSIRQVLNPNNIVVSIDGWDRIDKIETPDKYTVRLHLKKPYAEFEPTFFSTGGANPCILPKHLLDHNASLNHVAYNSLPVGIGPFKYLRWDRGSEVVLVPNEKYFRGRPKLDRVEFKIITDTNTVLTQLETGELDLWMPAGGYYMKRLQKLHGFTTHHNPTYMFNHIDFNMSNPILADKRVRLALRSAIDRPTLLKKVAQGYGSVQESYLSPAYPNVPPPIPAVPYDPVAANRLLDQAGWHIGSDGIRTKNGQKMRFLFAMGPQSPDSDTVVELLRAWWMKIGVAIDVRNYTSPIFFGQPPSGIIATGKFDLTMFSWQVDALDNSYDIFSCNAVPPKGQNDTRYCNPKADALMQQFNVTYDPVEQRRIKTELLKIFVEDAPLVVTKIPENIYAANTDLKGFRPNQVSGFDDMMNVDI